MASPVMKRCPSCDAAVEPADAWCTTCGAALAAAAPSAATAPAGQPVGTTPGEPSPEAFRTEPGEPPLPVPPVPAAPLGPVAGAPRAKKTALLEEGTIVDNKYAVVRVLGEGGMGVVYLARDVHTKVEVVLKAVRPELAHRKDVRERTLAEGRALARIDHPNVVHLNAVVADADSLWLVMQYIEGESLDRTIKRYAAEANGLPLTVALDLFKQVLAGVAAAHREGVIHRDLKPANVLVRRKDGVAKVTDFGIAKPTDEAREGAGKTKGVIGSLWYMSPEQVQGRRDLDPRADVYALGILFFEMLAGHVPFDAPSSYEIMRKHVEEELPRVGALRPELPGWVDDVLSRACAKNREDRFASCEEFLATIQALAGGQATMVGGRPTIVGAAEPAPRVSITSGTASMTAPGEPAPRSRAPWIVGALLLAGVGGAVAYQLGSGPTGRPAAPPSAAVSATTAPEGGPAGADPSASAAPSAAPPDPLSTLEGRWRTESNRELEAVRAGDRVEFRIVDAAQFAPADYRAGEARFVLAPGDAADVFLVEDKIRPEPPLGFTYDSDRARTSCQEVWSAVDGRPLRAVLAGDRITIDFAKIAPASKNFLREEQVVTSCTGLRDVPASVGRTVLLRAP